MTSVVDFAKEIVKLDEENQRLKGRLKSIEAIINMAEDWSLNQDLSESAICMGALKDVRRIVRGRN